MSDARTILLVDADAPRLGPEMEAAEARLHVTPSGSLAEARAHLSGTRFDLIVASGDLPDGNPLRLFELGFVLPPMVVRTDTSEDARDAERAGARMAFAAAPDARVLAAVAARQTDLTASPRPPAGASGGGVIDHDESSVATVLMPVRDALADMVHEVNNPLAVISGNAQLARELMAMVPDDEAIPGALHDIELAAGEILDLMSKVTEVRRQVEAALGETG